MPIRAVALAIIRRNKDQILVQEIISPDCSTTFYRPIGGTIEVGENSQVTLVREIKEELNQEVEEPNLVAVIENIFKVEEIGHEIDFIYEAEFKDRTLYNREEFEGIEGKELFKAIWKPINDFVKTEESIKLVPDGLLEFLTRKESKDQRIVTHIKTI
ncbi:NUDIX hydrolase [Paenibacillus wulumuqiensis]|uniref:NUDIX hydrolase n=1 Tax=Paenibacillus wulumuqiensis TaxID=1567107 RepID=UPI00061926D6|nr:NUDIX domain-containing protein [Paenibacillus wulumuqiensis]